MVDVILEAMFPAQPSYRTRIPRRVEVRQVDYQHDMAVIIYDQESGTQQTFREGTPVIISWGSQQRPETFVGYVLYTRQNVEAQRHSLRVVCIGPSQDFKDADHAVLTDVTLDQAVSRFALANNFDVVLDGLDSHRYESVSWTSGESAWQFFVRTAQRQGYALFANRTTVFCYDPVKVLLADVDSLPVLTYIHGRNADLGTLSTFVAQRSSGGAGRLSNRDEILLGVDPRSAALIAVQPDGTTLTRIANQPVTPRYKAFVQHQPVADAEDARNRTLGRQRANRWVSSAKATAFGQTKMRQGRGVIVSGVDPGNDGLWYIKGVTHVIDKGDHPTEWSYTVDLDLLRDAEGLAAAHQAPVRSVRSRAYTPRPEDTVLENGRWRAQSPRPRRVLP